MSLSKEFDALAEAARDAKEPYLKVMSELDEHQQDAIRAMVIAIANQMGYMVRLTQGQVDKAKTQDLVIRELKSQIKMMTH